MVPEDAQTPDGKAVHVVGSVQGLVIGDHNTVNQSFNVTRHEAYVAREYPPVPAHWIERASLVVRAATALNAGSLVALWGMAGSGKTTLAARVAAEVASRFTAGCFWIDLAAGDTDQSLLRIALAFGHDISLLKSRDARAQTVRSLMAGRSVLLVFDDAWTAADLDAFLPLPSSCAGLLTTRDDSLAASVATEVVMVEELVAEDAVALLAAVSGSPATDPLLRGVAEAFGGLPLALELAGKLARQQARRPGFSWTAFAASFRDGTGRLSLGLAGASVRAAFDATWTRALGAEVQRAFALLGIFQPGEISTAEAVAAWAADDTPARAHLDELIDLSLIRLVDAVTLRLHPLLFDYAREMTERLTPEEQTSAHCRVADYLFRIAPRPPHNLRDMAIVLRSHLHAAKARDRDRSSRVYPWFNDGDVHVAVPSFLLDHGQHRTLVIHERLQLEFAKDSSAWARSFALFGLGEALLAARELPEAEERMQQAVGLMKGPDVDADGRAIGLAKFLMGLGQVQAQLGKLDAAEATFRHAVDFDRKVAAGGVSGAREGALIGLLQLADLLAQSNRPNGDDQAERISRDVYAEAAQHGSAQVAVMALTRLARQFVQSDPAQALKALRVAQQVGKDRPEAFAGRQGARYARLLAESAKTLVFNGQPALDDTLALLCLAIGNAGRCGAQQELGQALYQLGNLFEHYHLIGREPPLVAAWACYTLSEAYTRDYETGSPLNAQFRIEERIVPRIEKAQHTTAAAAVVADPWGLIDAALAPHALGWRPDP
jgi:tetratricopeptide (TPR) repeat protein